MEQCNIPEGKFDNVSMCRYTVPDYWDIGEVYERLIEDIYDDAEIEKGYGIFIILGLMHIFRTIIQYFYYQPRDYIAACYKAGEIL